MKPKNKKIYIIGNDTLGWSIDKDRTYFIKVINSFKGYELTNSFFKADIIYAIWWNQIFSFPFSFLLRIFSKKPVIATITNDLEHQRSLLQKAKKYVNIFVYANSKQKRVLLEEGVRENQLYFNPFYVDENLFKKINLSKKKIAQHFNIDYALLSNRFLIGSFQRDSLGGALDTPKWQKNPDMLIDILKKLNSKNTLLLLAGPRRHYIINQCRKYKIPYFFIGDERYIDKKEDDLLVNAIEIEDMPYLYNLIDLYIVSSKSEGGPKAIPESVLSGCKILSSDVGFAKDLLDEQSIYTSADDAVKKITSLKEKKFQHKVDENYQFNKFQERIESILRGVE